eukprot:TRINITY_DN67_c0_g2_i1.p1 TRINITY_DN67_c0_g2~~TRINITY_DN67_c0_g2_i1.p1  ORF type:complete len:222 (-),score=60.97 TRINITY_DN67_c0_g2_i1:82-747(-)
MSQIVLHGNPLSQHGRIVEFFLHAAGIAFEGKTVDIPAGAHKSPEYLALNPSGQVPTLQHGSTIVYESGACLRYLAHVHPSTVYPIGDLPLLALVETAYEHIRQKPWDTVSGIVGTKVIMPVFYKQALDEEKLAALSKKLATQFEHMEAHFFKHSSHHVVGQQLTLADIALGSMLSQLSMAKFDLTPFSKIKAFWDNIQTVESYKKSHAAFDAVCAAVLPK